MSDRTDWAAFASVLDGEREAIRAGLPDGVACTLSLTAYGGLPTTYAVLLRHAASGAGAYGSGPTPADALAVAAAKLRPKYAAWRRAAVVEVPTG